MAVGYSYAGPGSGRFEIGDAESGGVGCGLFSRLRLESVKLFEFVLVDFLSENIYATQHERHH